MPQPDNSAAQNVTIPAKRSNQKGCIGDWIKTNSFWEYERNIGKVKDQIQCVEKAKKLCPDHDLVNVH